MSKKVMPRQRFNEAMDKVAEGIAMFPELENDFEEKVKVYGIVRDIIEVLMQKKGIVIGDYTPAEYATIEAVKKMLGYEEVEVNG